MKTLTYIEAHEMVDAAAQMGALPYLCEHWIGNTSLIDDCDTATGADRLHDYVSECADAIVSAGWDTRSGKNPPVPDDESDTGLAQWEGVL